MLLGVISDTHGCLDTTRSALKLLQSHHAEYFIHCGDVGGEPVLNLFTGLRTTFVCGNCDHDPYALQRHATILGIHCAGAMGRLTLDDKLITVLHGDDHRQMQRILDEQDCDLLFFGHTHVKTCIDIARIRAINPGAIHRATTKTVALVNTATRDVQFLVVQ